MEIRKIFKVGNSCAVSLPVNMMKTLGLAEGSHISVEIMREQHELILRPVIAKKSDLPIDFVRMVDKVLVDYEYAIRRLGK